MGNGISYPEAPSITWEDEPFFIENSVSPVPPPKALDSKGKEASPSSGDSAAAGSNTDAPKSRFDGGRVFTIANENFSKHLAMKIYDKCSSVEVAEWLTTRRKLCSKLSGAPYIVPIYKTYQDEDRLYMLMPFFSGGDLAHYLDNGFAFTYKAARSAIATVVIALQHLHVQGIVHEDVRPENIFIDSGGACHLTLTKSSLWLSSSKVALPRMVIDYTSPEVLRGSQPSPASDWWSFGAVFAHMVQGHPPFDAPNEKLLRRHIFSEPPNLSYSLPAPLKALLNALLTKDPSVRLSSAAKVITHPFFNKIDWDAVRSISYESLLQPSSEGTDLTAARNADGELLLEAPTEKLDASKNAVFSAWDWHPKRKHGSSSSSSSASSSSSLLSSEHKTIDDDYALLNNAVALADTGCPLESTVDGVGRVIFALSELPVGKSFQTLNGNKLQRTEAHLCVLSVPRKRETKYELFVPTSASVPIPPVSPTPSSSTSSSSSASSPPQALLASDSDSPSSLRASTEL